MLVIKITINELTVKLHTNQKICYSYCPARHFDTFTHWDIKSTRKLVEIWSIMNINSHAVTSTYDYEDGSFG